MQQYFSILKSKYDQESFTKFAHELLNDVEIGNVNLPINPAFNDHIESFYYLGSFVDPQGKNLHILDVNLKTNTKIEQARTMQRNLIARYLKDHWLDGALVAFHNDRASSWRLSYIKVEYKYDEKGKPTEELTPARRYSFLVGEGEPSHTAQMQLAKIYELTSQNPSLAQLEEAFGVEKVTKEFFDKYRDLFESVVAELKSNHTFQNEASKNNIDTESFAKKLLGQIVFLYFLQKKGWLGVPKGKSWGEGDKMFLRNIYNQAISENKNFFNNYLEVLFYDTLNNARNDKVDRNYSDFFQSKVPFLNGGLFEPQYDWKNSLMYLDNRLFDKILGVFDTYNFTVKEDEPLEKEVAVDPEMLGKVFENLLEENLRKGKGTYYTPREIVHYMCEESLINFLATETNLEPDDVKNKYFPAYNKLVDEKIEVRDVSVSETIIESLKNIKVVDPACGSGAFLVGMLQQITQLRNDLETRSKLLGTRDDASTEYEIKKQTIQNCIYGVDIDPGAIDIAKLRLWLSLVVDYDLEEIEPLPNLDYKLMQGNSLLEELVLGDTSIKLYDSEGIKKIAGSKRMKNLFDRENQISLFDGDSDKVMKSLKSLQLKYFSTSDSQSKKEIRNKIEQIEHELIETSVKSSLENLKSQKGNVRIMPGIGILPEDVKRLEKITSKENQIFAVLEELNKTGTKPFFLWHLYFSDVFEEKGGFDIVIANPPYVDSETMVKEENNLRDVYQEKYESARGNWDLYIPFMELGLNIMSDDGIASFITPNKWYAIKYGQEIRKLLDGRIFRVGNCNQVKVFEAGNSPVVTFFTHRKLSSEINVDVFGDNYQIVKHIKAGNDSLDNDFGILLSEYLSLVLKIQKQKSRVSDYYKCENPCSVSEAYEIKKILKDEPGNNLSGPEYFLFVNTGTIDKYLLLWGIRDTTYLKTKYKRPYVIRQDYKNKYARRYDQMTRAKLIISGMRHFESIIDLNGSIIAGKSTEILVSTSAWDLKLALGIFNSKLIGFFIKQKYGVLGIGGGINFTTDLINSLPLPDISDDIHDNLLVLVNNILELTKSSDYIENSEKQKLVREYSDKIDQIIFELYKLNKDEIEIVKNN